MILWFVDRFGMPGEYQRIWFRVMTEAGLKPARVKLLSLHKLMGRQLLIKYGTRKAPTWIPEIGDLITAKINEIVEQTKPEAVVFAAPEALAFLGINPEVATLHTLRGSVYWRGKIPYLVTLPISAWKSMVNQKDIGAANYGFDSQQALEAEGEQRALRQKGNDGRHNHHHDSSRTAGGSHGRDGETAGTAGESSFGAAGAYVRKRFGDNSHRRVPSNAEGPERSALQAGADSGSTQVDDLARLRHDGSNDHRQSDLHRPDPDSEDGVGGDVLEDAALRDVDRGERFASGDDGLQRSGEADTDYGEADSVGNDRLDEESGESEASDGRADSDSLRDDAGPVEVIDREDFDIDRFFYEPVLSPVGRFVITADVKKLARILLDGKGSTGLSEPIELNW